MIKGINILYFFQQAFMHYVNLIVIILIIYSIYPKKTFSDLKIYFLKLLAILSNS